MLRFKTKAYTLLELMLVLIVIAGILLVIYRYFAPTRQTTNITAATRAIKETVNASYLAVQRRPNFALTPTGSPGPLTMGDLVNEGYLPKTFLTYANPWRGSIEIKPAADNNQIEISMTGIPDEALCNNLAGRLKADTVAIVPACTSGQQANTFTYTGVF